MDAYQDAIRQCSQKHAPWYVVPADRKWYRNWVLSDVLVRTLEGMDMKYPKPAPGLDKIVVE
jgi:polyphosphate kinase 2 (PPK2 family)